MRAPNAFEPMTERELARSLWYLEHRVILRKTLIGILLTVNIALAIVVFGELVRDIMLIQQRKAMFAELVSAPSIRAVEAPNPLVVGAAQTLVAGDRVDIVLPVENTNAEFTAFVRYAAFDSSGKKGVWEDVVPPRTRMTLVALALPRTSSALSVAIQSVSWRRTRAHIEGRYEDWKARVGTLRAENIARAPAIGGEGAHVVFTLRNDTAFHLLEIPLVVLLWRGQMLVAVNRVVAENVLSGSTRAMAIRWMDPVGPFQTITVEPHVDLLDAENRYVPSS
jgi:hypothetical protein